MIHNKKKRMPAILKESDWKSWISNTINKERSMKLLAPFDEKQMEAYTISKLITSKVSDPNTPKVLEPYEYKELEVVSGQRRLF